MKAYNLTELARRLRATGRQPRLVSAIERWGHRNSRLVDLEHAQALLKQFETLRSGLMLPVSEPAGENPLGDLQGALFANAVILYVRAALSGDNGRWHGVDLTRWYSAAQRQVHDRVISLRNSVIAHYDEDARQDWLRDAVVLVVTDAGWRYRSVFAHLISEGTLYVAFRDLVDFVIPLMRREFTVENDHLHDAMVLAQSSDLQQELDACGFDADEFYGPGQPTQQILAAMLNDGGPGSFVMTVGFRPRSSAPGVSGPDEGSS